VSKKEDAEFPLVKSLRERIFQIPLLPQEAVVGKFAYVDSLIYPLAIRLCEDVPIVREHFVRIVHKVASGNTLGKNYFNKNDNEDEKNPLKKELLKKSEFRVLSEAYGLLRHQHSPKKFCKILMSCGFIRGVMEEAVEVFLNTTDGLGDIYEKLEAARLSHSLDYMEYETKLNGMCRALGLKDFEFDLMVSLWDEVQVQWVDYLEKREEIISPYYRKVYTIADAFSSTNSQTLDNFQNGVAGLIRAYKCYTASRFAAFSLVAEQWIKQSVLLYIKTEANFIKVPIANWHSYQKFNKAKEKLEKKNNREATLEDIAKETKTPLDKIKKTFENIKLAKVRSINLPTPAEEEHGQEFGNWSMDAMSSVESNQADVLLESMAEYITIKKVAEQFDAEETLIFALASGCLDLIDNSHISPIEIEKEQIRQKARRVGLQVIFKTRGKDE
jgi:RNA polymerase sigma factor (sigma-70 family)